MHKKIFVLIAMLAIFGLFLAACKNTDAPVSNQGDDVVYEQVSTGGFKISVSPQDARDGLIVVARVESPSVSWLAIHKMKDGEPGDVIGYTELETGVSQNVTVEIDMAEATPTMFAIIHADSGALGEFEYPQFDPPIEADGRPVEVSFHAIVEGGDVYVTVNDQELENDTVLVDEIFVFNPPVWVAIFNDEDGQPSEMIGYEFVEDGSIEYIPVEVETEKATPTLYAILYVAQDSLSVFDPDEALTVEVYGEPVMTTFEVTLP
ncbi:MAG: hypothetical protein JXB38_02265 [Anaerolineales bacterium]|nr:hypothetical protein [Anaerolineales bacterium]